MEYDFSGLVEKMERIEQENARLKRSTRLTKLLMVCAIAAYAAFASVPRVMSVTSPPVLTATGFHLVDTSNRLRASLAPTTDGYVLTFYDSTGKKTLTLGNSTNEAESGLILWDGNKIITGKGIPRVALGESSPAAGALNGFGFDLWDNTAKLRNALYLSFDGSQNGMVVNALNGSSTGVFASTAPEDQDQGFFANDLHGKNRIFVGNSLNGSSFDVLTLSDETGAPRTGITAPSNADIGYFNQDANGRNRIALYESANGLIAGLSLAHRTGIEGADAIANDESGFVGSNFATWNSTGSHIASIIGVGASSADDGFVDTYLHAGTLSGHLP
jgi:hypothetical protein